MEIYLTQGQVAVIDDVDADLVALKWYAAKGRKKGTFYAKRSNRKPDGSQRLQALHQVIARRMGIVGAPDHIDRDGLNNRRNNLRAAPSGRNNANREGWSTSGYRGVTWHKSCRKWKAHIQVDGKRPNLGLFVDPIEAAKAYDRAALASFGDFAVLNFPV